MNESPLAPLADQAEQIAPGREATRLATLLHVGRRRVHYIGRYLYWTVRHRSTKHAAWVCHYEGIRW